MGDFGEELKVGSERAGCEGESVELSVATVFFSCFGLTLNSAVFLALVILKSALNILTSALDLTSALMFACCYNCCTRSKG